MTLVMIVGIAAITAVVLVLLDKGLTARGTTDWPILRQNSKLFSTLKTLLLATITVATIAVLIVGAMVIIASMLSAL